MKRVIILVIVNLLWAVPTASADVYVKVDAQGNAISGAIMCDAVTCGAGSLFSSLTLNPGESYVLQGAGNAGIGNNNPGVDVKHEATTNQWVVTNNNAPVPTVERFETIETRVIASPVAVTPTETKTVTSDTATVIMETATVIIQETVTTNIDYSNIDWETMDWETFNWEDFLTWLTAYIENLLAVKP
jgi:hypothetical protein